MAAVIRSSIWLVVLAATLLALVQHVEGQYCTRTLYRYTRRSYRAYRSRGSVYYYGCGFWGWGSCRGTRYHREAYTSYNSIVTSYRACCSGYGTTNCHALCMGSTSCPNGGTCRAPNSCSCRPGWTGSRCTTDVNECSQRNTHRCHSNASCRNNRGSYTCYCNAGYQGSGFTCSDIDECRSNNGGCQHNCHNTVGSYRCSCRAGYRLSSDGHRCEDVNECSSNNGGCQHNCHNSVGSFTCSCNRGYQLSGNSRTCNDINECLTANGGCHHNCHNLIGSYRCTCNGGYDLNGDGHTCEVPPPPPTNLQVSSVGIRTATLMWQKPVIRFQNSLTDISSYQVIATQSQFPDLVNVVVTVSARSYTFPHTLQEYTLYSCTVKARNTFGLGNASHSVEFRTLQAAPSASPQSVSGVVQSSTILSFTWSPPPPVDINGLIQYYEVKLHEVETRGNSTFYTNHPNINLGSLHPYYSYRFQVAARTTARGPFSEPLQLRTLETSPTAPPSNPYVTPNNSTSFTFSWGLPPADKINGIIRHYIIEITEHETQSMSQYQATSTEITLQSLHPHYTYMCRVAAETVGIGPYTSNITVQLPEDAPSEAPSNITGYAVDSTTISLLWNTIAPENINGILRHYLVSILENNTGGTMEYIANSTNITISSLHPHYIYLCKVAAVTNMVGPSSQNIKINTPQDVPSGPPLTFSVVATTPRSLYFSWEPPRPEEQNGVIVGYVVNVTSDHSMEVLQLYSDLQETNVSVAGLKPYTVYVCAVAAITIPGVGPYSDEDTILMPEDVPTEPRNVSVTQVVDSPTQLHVQWEEPEDHNGIIQAYTVYCRTNTSPGTGAVVGYSVHEVVLDSYLQTLIDELTPFTDYECYVTANTSAGEGNPSVALTAVTDESTPHDAPTYFSGLMLNSTAVFLNWSSPTLPYGIIISYTITYSASSNDTQDIRLAGNETTNYTVQGLNEDTIYRFAVYASTRIGAGPSDEVTARTDEYYPHSPPSDVQIVHVGRREATITWQLPVFEDQNGVIVYYQLIASQSQFNISDINVDINTTSHTLTNLEEHVEYIFMVAAATRIGVGPFSSPMNFTTLEDVPSEPPQSPSGVAHSPTLVTLTWSSPSPIDINGNLQYYVVKMTEVESGRYWKFFALDSFIRIGALHPYYHYRNQVAAHTIDTGPFTDPFYVQTQESAPTAPPSTPQVSELTAQSFNLIWQPPPFEATNGEIRQYILAIVEVETELTFEVTANSTQMIVGSLHPHYNYLCKVQAVTVDSGPFSEIISVHLLESVPAGPPQNVSGIAISSTAIALSWRAPLFEDRNGIIRHYIVNVTELETLNEFSQATTHLEIVLSTLHPHYTYECAVYAVTIGPGPGSAANITTLEEAPSGYPQNVAVTNVSSKSVHLSWEPPSPGEQNGVISGYIVNITSTNGDGFEFFSISNQPVVYSLNPHRTYLLTVAAVTAAGIGPSSPAVTATTLEDAPTSAPQGLEVSAIDPRTIFLSWAPPPLEQQNGNIREYRVNISERETGKRFHLVTAAASVTVPTLHPFYTYNCTVAAFTVEEGPHSVAVTITMPEDVPSSGPVMFRVINLTATSAVFTWDAPPLEDHNGIIIGYSINVTKLQTGERQELFSNSTMITVYSLQPYTVYICISTAITSVGHGPFSDATRFQTSEARPDSPPKNFTAFAISSRSAHLSWLPPPREHRNGLIRHFWINITEINTGRKFERTLFSTATVLSSLHPYYTYQFSVAAYTVSLGPFTTAFVLKMPQDAPSSPPTNFSGTALSSRSILLSWGMPPIEGQNGVITGYNVSTTELETEEVTEVFIDSYNLTLDSLRPYTTYGFSVSARTVAGSGPSTHLLYVRTHEEAPAGEVTNLTALFIGSTSIHISWNHPPADTHFGVIREYRINVTELETGAVFNLSTGSETTEITVESLHPFYTYTFVIVPVTVDVGTNSAEITIRTEEAAPSQPPMDIVVSAIHSRSAEFAWAPPQMNHRNGIIRRYIVAITTADGLQELVTYSREPATLVENLHPFKNYSCSVSAETVAPGPFSPAILVQTLEDAPTAPPEDLVAIPLDPRTLYITWKPPAEEDRNGIIRRFVINITELDTGTSLELESVNTGITVQDLHPFYRYSLSVAAESVALGPATSDLITEMPEDVSSAPPNNVTATDVTAFSLILRWNPPPSEHQNGIIREYLINITEEDSGRELQIRSLTTELRVQFLHPHYTYTFTVATWTTAVGPFSDPLQVVTSTASPSSEPRNVSAVNISSTAICFSWQPPHFEDRNGLITGYVLNITSLKTGTTQEIFTHSTIYTLESLSPHTVYTTAVAAETSAGRGPFSAKVSVQTLEDEPSASPQDVSHTAVTSTSVDLSWSPPPAAHHNGIIRHYTVRVVVEDTGKEFTINSTDPQITIRSLHPYYIYDFSVSAVTVSPGPYSDLLTVQTLPDVPTGSPEIISAEAIDPTTVHLSWNPPKSYDQNGIIVYYIINITSFNLPTTESFSQHCTTLSCNISNLHPYYTYQFTVLAVTIGPGPYSEAYTFTTLEAAPGAPPQNVSAEVLNPNVVFLTWSPPLPDQQNGVIRHYLISQYETSTGILTNYTQEGDHTDLVIGSLHAYYEYQFTIAAQTVQLGPFSNPVAVTTFEAAPTGAPSNLTALAVNSTSVYLSWLLPAENELNGNIRHFNIRAIEVRSGRDFHQTSTNNSMLYTGLHPAYIYQFAVAAVTVESGPYSDFAVAKTLEDVPSESPSILQSVIVNSSTVLVTWLPPPLEYQNGIITAYVVNVSLEGSHTEYQLSITSSLNLTLERLHPFSTYIVVVAAETDIGRGPFSSPFIIHTPEDAPSAPPQGLKQVAIASTWVTLNWQPPPVKERNGNIRHYLVFVTELETQRSFTLNSTMSNYRVENLHPFYTYNIRIAAVTVATGSRSDAIFIQTLEDVPSGPPQRLVATNVTSRSMFLTWDPPESADQNGIIQMYTIDMTVAETGENLQLTSEHTEFHLDKLHPYYTYSFVISAVTTGRGPPSTVYNVTTGEEVPGGPPQNMTADAISSTQILLLWKSPPSDVQNGRIHSYAIFVLEIQTNTTLTYEVNTSLTYEVNIGGRLQVGSLHPYFEYECSVAAVTIGPGPYTSPLSVETFEDIPSGPPMDIAAVAIGPRKIHISWSPPFSWRQNGIIRSYIVNLAVAETKEHIQLTSNSTSLTAESLHPYYSYNVTVAAVTIGVGPFSADSTAQTSEDVPTGPPENVQVDAISSTSIKLAWHPPNPPDQNGIIQAYNITLTEAETGRQLNFQEEGTESVLVVNFLHPYYTYQCSISAVTIGPGPAAYINVTTHQDVPNSGPQNIRVTPQSATLAEINWNPPLLEDQNGIIVSYTLVVTRMDSGSERELRTDNTSIVVVDLHPFSMYQIIIAAETIGLGNFSNPVSFQMLEASPGATVSNFTVEVISATSVELSWLPPDPHLWNGVITNYTVTYQLLGPVGITPTSITDAVSTMSIAVPMQGDQLANNANPMLVAWPLQRETAIVDDLQEYSVYTFSAFIVNSAGRSQTSQIIIQELPGAEPSAAPNAIQIRVLSSTSAEMQWQPPDLLDQNGVITGYTVILTSTDVYNLTSNETHIHIEGLHKYTRYFVRIAAESEYGSGPLSNPVVFWTLEDYPGPPRNVTVSISGGPTALLSWMQPEEPNGVITKYLVFYAGYETPGDPNSNIHHVQPLDGPSSVLADPEMLQTEILGIIEGLTYVFKVRTLTSVGYGNYSSNVTAYIPRSLWITVSTGSNETGVVEVDSEVQSRSNAGAATAFAVLGWLTVLGVLVVVALLWYWYRKRTQRKYKAGQEMELAFRNAATESLNSEDNAEEATEVDASTSNSENMKENSGSRDTSTPTAADEGNTTLTGVEDSNKEACM